MNSHMFGAPDARSVGRAGIPPGPQSDRATVAKLKSMLRKIAAYSLKQAAYTVDSLCDAIASSLTVITRSERADTWPTQDNYRRACWESLPFASSSLLCHKRLGSRGGYSTLEGHLASHDIDHGNRPFLLWMRQSRPLPWICRGSHLRTQADPSPFKREINGGCSHSSAKNKKGSPQMKLCPCRPKDCAELLTFGQPQFGWVFPIIDRPRKATWAGMSRSEPNDLTVKVSPSRWRCTRSLKSG
jgi:hypothetical protein